MKVFVYGTLMSGMRANHFLQTSNFVENDVIPANTFEMYSLGFFPALVESNDSTPVIGEVYEITSEVQGNLDRYEGYPYHYDRKQVTTEKGHLVWVYYMKENRQNKVVVEHGSWRQFINENPSQARLAN